MNAEIDVLGLGAVAVDDILYVEAYPVANSKVRVLNRERHCGGLTATALVAAARLGCHCAYAGVTGDDESSDFALAALAQAGIRTDLACRRSDRRIHHSTIIVDHRGTRTLLSDNRSVRSVDETWPAERIIRSCAVLLVDHTAMDGMVRVSRTARSAGIPVVGDLERTESELSGELVDMIDHLIVPEQVALAMTARNEPREAAAALWTGERKIVVVTCGENGCWYLADGREPVHQPAYRVHVVDTTGCGDVFHGAYAAGLVLGLSPSDRVRLASATAALKATKRGGQAGCPTMAEVKSLLAGR